MSNEQSNRDAERFMARLEMARSHISGGMAEWPPSADLDPATVAALDAVAAIDRARRILREGR